MKKIFYIAITAVVAILAISCQKEIIPTELNDEPVQYTFNISVNEKFGFDSDASTKGGAPAYKTAWSSDDRIFLFFKPASGNLLEDTYATLTYNGSTWEGSVTGTSDLGESGKLSAVYVYKLDSSVNPVFSNDQWTVETGNVFYNCQTDVSYTVSGGEITASLDLKAPADFVRIRVMVSTNTPMTCDKVKGWKDVVIGNDMTFSNASCTGYMSGVANGPSFMEFYGRIVGGGTSLKGVTCNFSIGKEGSVYERTTTPATDAKAFEMGLANWTEAPGKLPGLFSVASGKQIRFSKGNLWYGPKTEEASYTFNFETNQYDISSSWKTSHVSNFYWSKTASSAYSKSYDYVGNTTDVLFTNATETTPKADFTVNGNAGVWRTLSQAEWQYLLGNHTYKYVSVNSKYGIVIAPDGFSGTIADSYDVSAWATAEDAGFVFLPNTGYRNDGTIIEEGDISCIYWTSTAVPDDEEDAYRMFFQWKGSKLSTNFKESGWREWAAGIRLVSDVK